MEEKNMKLGITGSDIISNRSGGTVHVINVINELKRCYDVSYFPNPEILNRLSKEQISTRLKELEHDGIEIVSSFYDIINKDYTYNNIIDIYSRENVDFLFSFDYGYLMGLSRDFTVILSKKMNIKFGLCIMAYGDQDRHILHYIYSTIKLSLNVKILLFRIADYINDFIIFKRLIKNKNLLFIAVVNNNYKKNINLKFKNIKVLSPSNGIDNYNSNILKYRTNIKENKIIFFARLHYMKGIFDIPIVLYHILKNTDTKLVITGNFDRTFKEEKIFWKLVDKYNLRDKIIYKGYLGNEELYNEISSSKLLLYPSHGDSFSISIAQALKLLTPVVAYDIAGLDIYKQFNAVKFVREFDYKGMAKEAVKILKMENTEVLFDNSIDKFITEHSWHNVAIQYKNIISDFLNK